MLNWNGWPDTLACVESLDRLDYPRNLIVVVDNGSTDDSITRLRQARPDLRLLEAGANLGFAGGNNIGIRFALERGADAVWLLNNDTEVESGTLAEMVGAALATPETGLVGSVLVDARDPSRIQAWGGGSVRWWLGLPREHRRPVAVERLDYLVGASLLVKREVFETTGLLDDGFFFYWEDVDFAIRAQAAGWRLAVAPGTAVRHKGGGTASRGEAHPSLAAEQQHLRSLARFMRKHHRLWLAPLLARGLLEVGHQVARRRASRIIPLWSALIQGAADARVRPSGAGTHRAARHFGPR